VAGGVCQFDANMMRFEETTNTILSLFRVEKAVSDLTTAWDRNETKTRSPYRHATVHGGRVDSSHMHVPRVEHSHIDVVGLKIML